MIGAYYYPEQWPRQDWSKDIEHFKKLGLHHIHLAEFAWIHLEPQEGQFAFEWLDEVIALATQAELDIILCTPSATPPIWLTTHYPDALMVKANGRRVEHGSRAHRCVNSVTFHAFSDRITEHMARRYGQHPNVIGWQIDNEIGHYGDAPCYCGHCLLQFRQFLRDKYHQIEELNRAWAGDFWSQNFQNFEQIPLPNRQALPYLPNEHAMLDFLTFFSVSLARFLERQAALLRRFIKPEVWITHNFMTNDPFSNPRHVRQGLELFTLTNYPVAGQFKGTPGTQRHRIGSCMDVAFHHDYTRGHNGRWGVMEQQPGQVNWGPHNARPYPGAVRLWLWTAIAHGAELLDTYRLRQPRGGAEQYHSGLIELDGQTVSEGGQQFAQVAAELQKLQPFWQETTPHGMNHAAILFDWASLTALALHPQSLDFDPRACWKRFYAGLKRLGLNVDILEANPALDLSRYAVVCPALVDLASEAMLEHWQRYAESGGHLLVSPRVATRHLDGHFSPTRYGERLARLMGAELLGYDVMPSGHQGHLKLESSGKIVPWNAWAEQWQPAPGSQILARHHDQFYAGTCAAFRSPLGKGWVTCLGVDAEGTVEQLIAESLKAIHPTWNELPEHTLYRTRGGLGVFLNYNDFAVDLPESLRQGGEILLGQTSVPPADLVIWKL